MKRRFALLLLTLPLLVGCKQTQIRKDIEEFVSSFSLQESFLTYRRAEYNDSKESNINGVYTRELERVYFDSRDEENLSYIKENFLYEEEELVSQNEEKCYKKDGEFYYELNGEISPSSMEKYELLVTKFFYKEIVEDTYHSRGMYYGDYVIDTCAKLQDLVTIKDDLYIMEYRTVDSKNNSEQYQLLKVNRLGMLDSNHVYMRNGINSISEDVIVRNFSE